MDFLRKLFGRKSSAATSSKESPLAKMAISWLRKGYEKEESGAVGEAHDCYEKALSYCEEAIEADSGDAEAYYLRAVLMGALGKLESQHTRWSINEWPLSVCIKAWKEFLKVAPAGYDRERIKRAKKTVKEFSDLA